MYKAYLIGLIKFKNQESFVEDFASKIPEFIKEKGGKILARRPESSFCEGRKFDLHVVVEFENFDDATTMLQSKEWQDLSRHRTSNSDTEFGSFMLIEGGDALIR